MEMKPVYQKVLKKDERSPVKCTWVLYQTKSRAEMDYQVKSNIFLAYHNELEFHYIKRGSGSYFIKNRKYPFAKNRLVVIKPMEMHALIPEFPTYIEKGSLYFLPSFVSGRKLEFITKRCPHIIQLTEKEGTLIEVILKNLAGEIKDRKTFWDEAVHSEIALFLSMVKRGALRKHPAVEKNPLTEKIIDYLENNFARDIPVSEIAKAFSLSVSRISHIFKKETGLSLKNYMLQRRIVEAKKLLAEDCDMKVSKISARLGFCNFSLFNRSFKKITGMTPTSYRRTSRQS